jgi:phage replication O-like protein O
MANPQKENGYTAIANEIMEILAQTPIRSEVRRIIDFVLRKTYGFNKKTDKISISQFEAGTKMKHSNICKALAEAVVKRLLLKTAEGFAFNKNFKEWVTSKIPFNTQCVAPAKTGAQHPTGYTGCCMTPYDVWAGGGEDVLNGKPSHVCNDDTRLQRDFIIKNGPVGQTYCSDAVTAVWAPGCN